MEDLKLETGTKIIAAQDQAYKSNIMQQRYWKQKQQIQTMSTIWRESKTRSISMPNIGK
jgi:hypothetical protein